MNGRTPTKAERLYTSACVSEVGCVACRLDGRDIENPAAWTEFHHDPDYGSTDRNAHFRGFGLCAVHHRGVIPGACRSASGVAVRHPILSNGPRFSERYGDDAFLCAYAWEQIPDHIKEEIGFDLSISDNPPDAELHEIQSASG